MVCCWCETRQSHLTQNIRTMNTTPEEWHCLGSIADLKKIELQEIRFGGKAVALSFRDGKFGAVGGNCLHAGGPLGQGRLDGDRIVCPWHGWKVDRCDGLTGSGKAGVEVYHLKEEGGQLWISTTPAQARKPVQNELHPLARPVKREPGPIRVVGISTTGMDPEEPRYSTSEALLDEALKHATAVGCETKLIKLNELKFKHCEGYYSKSAGACTWPCTLTQMDDEDNLEPVYEALVHWADVSLIATPIRWGVASSLYFKMAERMNCVQNQITINDLVLIQNKVASFIITGGQDNVQGVAGQMLTFFSELGFTFPQFPYVAHSRGWSAEDMENNIRYVQESEHLREGARELLDRAVAKARLLLEGAQCAALVGRGGRKAGGGASKS